MKATERSEKCSVPFFFRKSDYLCRRRKVRLQKSLIKTFREMKEIQTMKPGPCFKRWSRANYGVFASLRRPVTIGVLSVGMSSILSLATGEAQAAEVDTMAYSKVLEIDEVAIVGTKSESHAQHHVVYRFVR